MKLTAPTMPVWIIAFALGLLGIIGHFIAIPTVTANQFWFVAVGFSILAIANIFKGL